MTGDATLLPRGVGQALEQVRAWVPGLGQALVPGPELVRASGLVLAWERNPTR